MGCHVCMIMCCKYNANGIFGVAFCEISFCSKNEQVATCLDFIAYLHYDKQILTVLTKQAVFLPLMLPAFTNSCL